LVFGFWFLVFGFWVFGLWSLGDSAVETQTLPKGRKPKTKNQKPKTENQIPYVDIKSLRFSRTLR
jgi:hypothetical protein